MSAEIFFYVDYLFRVFQITNQTRRPREEQPAREASNELTNIITQSESQWIDICQDAELLLNSAPFLFQIKLWA